MTRDAERSDDRFDKSSHMRGFKMRKLYPLSGREVGRDHRM